MHFTKPALVAASLLWATSLASPINSPTILRTRGLIGGSTTNDITKNTTGSTTANNASGNDKTNSVSKSNAIEDTVGGLNLNEVTGALDARDALKHHHHHNNEGDGVESTADGAGEADGAFKSAGDAVNDITGGGDMGDATGGILGRDILRRRHLKHHKGDGAESTADGAGEADGAVKSAGDAVNDITGGGDMGDATGDILRRDVERLHHGHKSQEGQIVDDALNIADDATPGGFIDRIKRRHHGHKNGENSVVNGAVGDAGDAIGVDDEGDGPDGTLHRIPSNHHSHGGKDTTEGGVAGGDPTADDAASAPGFLTGILRRLVLRDNDGTVHDTNQAVHDANKAVHDANKAVHQANQVVHNTLHGLLHGILR